MTLEDEFLKSKTESPQKKALNFKLGVKLKKVPPGAKMKDVKALFSDVPVKNVIFQKGAVALVSLGTEAAVQKALAMKTASLRGHSVLIRPLPQVPEGKEKAGKKGLQREFFPQRGQKEMEKEVEETGRLYFRNLPYELSEADLDGLCAPFGLLAEAFVPWDARAGRNRGFAFVSFVHPSEAVRAFRALDKKEVSGRRLHVLPGREAPAKDALEEEEEAEEAGGTKTAFQRDRLAKRKREEGTAAAERAWNPLLINATALAEVQSAELGVSKEQLLDSRTRGSAAVRLAQLELALMGDLEEFLKEQGAHVASLKGSEEEGRVVRSRNAFLIKNLPAFSRQEDLEPLLSRHGDLLSLKMAPKGLLAIASFRQSVQARRAFAHVAFAEFKDSVLKVEWLPQLRKEFAEAEAEAEAEEQDESPPSKKPKIEQEISSKKKAKKSEENEVEDEEKARKKKRSKKAEAEPAAEAESKRTEAKSKKAEAKSRKEEASSKEAEAKSMKEEAESMKTETKSKKAEAKSMKKEAKSRKEEEESKKEEAESRKEEAKSKKTESKSKKTEAKSKEADGRSSTVVLVRNVPFQANRKELEELFRPFGSLARVRLPVKAGGGIRGFAFVEFGDEESAEALLAADKRMHLYGRRLRLEAALTDTGVSSVRAQALASLTGAMEAEQQRKRKSKVKMLPELPPEAL